MREHQRAARTLSRPGGGCAATKKRSLCALPPRDVQRESCSRTNGADRVRGRLVLVPAQGGHNAKLGSLLGRLAAPRGAREGRAVESLGRAWESVGAGGSCRREGRAGGAGVVAVTAEDTRWIPTRGRVRQGLRGAIARSAFKTRTQCTGNRDGARAGESERGDAQQKTGAVRRHAMHTARRSLLPGPS
jgi:hypothetical protein